MLPCVKERLIVRKVLPLLCTTSLAVILCIIYTQDQKREYQKYSKIETTRYSRPNILFILSDDLGYNDVSYHGSEIKTPNLDALAISGVRLENYYVQPLCTPTRSQLLSGRYQIHTGLQHGIIWHMDPVGLPLGSKTMADKLSDAGYSTHIVGKWHLGFYKKDYLPTRRGFHSFFGFLSGHNSYFEYKSTLKSYTGFDLRENEEPADVKKYSGTYSTTLFADKVIDLFKRNDTGKPLFVYLPFQAVHGPLQVPEQYLEQYDFIKSDSRRRHAAMVSCMDEAIGNITKALKEMGKWDNTLLIFSTDNGGHQSEGSNWPLRGYKGDHWEGGIRAVGFVHGNFLNDNIRGTVSRELLHVTDWFPTLVNLAGGDLNGTKPLDGYNQWETISEGKPSKRDEFLINIDPGCVVEGRRLFNETFDTNIYAGLRHGKWKLVTGVTKGRGLPRKMDGTNHWLFNIEDDPNEQTELSLQYPELVRFMLNRLDYYQSTAVPLLNRTMDRSADPKLHGGFWGPWQD